MCSEIVARLTYLGGTPYKYTKEVLAEAAAAALSIAGVLRYLGLTQSGGGHAYISRRLKHFGIDTSHFRREAPNRGEPSPRRVRPDELLVIRPPGSNRPKATMLRRVSREVGVPYECAVCKLGGQWRGRPIVLHVDRSNGDWLDNRRENLLPAPQRSLADPDVLREVEEQQEEGAVAQR